MDLMFIVGLSLGMFIGGVTMAISSEYENSKSNKIVIEKGVEQVKRRKEETTKGIHLSLLGYMQILSLILITLKCAGIISINWFLVTLPITAPVLIILVCIIINKILG